MPSFDLTERHLFVFSVDFAFGDVKKDLSSVVYKLHPCYLRKSVIYQVFSSAPVYPRRCTILLSIPASARQLSSSVSGMPLYPSTTIVLTKKDWLITSSNIKTAQAIFMGVLFSLPRRCDTLPSPT